ncbi:DeoR family transcriptional regulator, partial [Rhizobium johnstonii]
MAAEFSVIPETVRRDLKHLEMEGHLRCIYGGEGCDFCLFTGID